MMRKAVFIAFVLLLLSLQNFAQNQILGKWVSEDKKGIIEIFQQKSKYYGKLVWLKPDKDIPSTDAGNPDKSKRSQPLLNLVILKDFDYAEKEWKNGTVYDPANGKTYACAMRLIDNNKLRIRGYWGPFYRTEIWLRKE
ncbi:MAG TPA: DUF2147 domain-containing protein [Pedobacter sp.]